MKTYWPLVLLAAIIGIPTEGIVLYNQVQQAIVNTNQAETSSARGVSFCIVSNTCDADGYDARDTGKPIKSLIRREEYTPQLAARLEFLRLRKANHQYLSPDEQAELAHLTLIVMEHVLREK